MPEPIIITTTKKRPGKPDLVYKVWRGFWQDRDGNRRSKSFGNVEVVSKAAARQAFVDAIAENKGPTAENLTVRDWTDRHIEGLDKAPNTLGQYRKAADQASECWGELKRLRSVTTADVERLVKFIRDTGVSDYTIRNRMISLAAMFARARVLPIRSKPYLRENPFDDAEIPNPKGVAPNTYLTIAQFRDAIDAAPSANIRALLTLLRLCGMRLEEALHVQVEHIDWRKRTIWVLRRDDRAGKGDSTKQAERFVEMSPAAYALVLARFEELAEGEAYLIDRTPLSGRSGRPALYMRNLLKRAGVLHIHKPNHDLRKSCADDWSVLHGCERSAEWCGHSVDVALKSYRRAGDVHQGILSGLGDPKKRLAEEYAALDAHFAPTCARYAQNSDPVR